MKNLLIITSIVLLLSGNVFADLIYLTTEELVEKSDLVVIGTLTFVSESFYGGGRTGQGKIEVETVLSGDVKTDANLLLKSKDKLHIKWDEGFACVNGMHKRTENQKGIWLLTIEDDGTVRASHPGMFSSLENLSEIKKIIKELNLKTSKSVVLANNTDSTSDALLRALLAIIVALILYRLLYRFRFKVKVKRGKSESDKS